MTVGRVRVWTTQTQAGRMLGKGRLDGLHGNSNSRLEIGASDRPTVVHDILY